MTGPDRGGRTAWRFTRRALARAGARAVRLRPSDPHVDELLHGLVVGGGSDVDARLYGRAEVGPGVDPVRDAFELAALARADAAGLPILGICRGAQLLNVWSGGTLQDDPPARRWRPRRLLLPVVEVAVSPGSVLTRVLGKTRVRVNALHHQSVESVGAGLEVCARTRSEVVQAIEDPRRAFRIGVQWHPELLPHSRTQHRLFVGLAEASRMHVEGPSAARSG